MFYAMNRFTVDKKKADEFSDVWKNRESRLLEMDGFHSFQLLKQNVKDDEESLIFISLTLWKDQNSFKSWTESEQFKQSHGKSKMPQGVILGPPKFESYHLEIDESK